jgi:polysaccharide export outer membrane protein
MMRRVHGILAAANALLLVALTSCAPGGDLQRLPNYQASGYTLGSGDQVRLITFGEDQLTGDFRVDDRGEIAMPLVGTLHAAGLTPQGLGEEVQVELKRRKLLQDPSVAVEVTSYRPVFILGEVAKPGEYPYQPGMTMLTTVAKAGGFTFRGFKDYASVVRTTDKNQAVTGLVAPSSYIAPGDVLTIYERHF